MDSHSRILRGLIGKLRAASAVILAGMVGLSFLPASVTRSDSSNRSLAETSAASEAMPNLRGDEAIEHLKEHGTYDSLQEAMAATRYEARWQSFPRLTGVGASYEFQNAANNLLAYITPDGIQATALGDKQKPWRLGLKLKDYGYGNGLSSLQPGEVKASQNRVSIQKPAIGNRQSAIEEWFVNSERGIEHGFTIASPPQSANIKAQTAIQNGSLRLRFEVSGDLQASIDGRQKGAAFSRESDNVVLAYDKLFALDASGRGLNAAMKLEAGKLVIEIDDAAAEYPLTIDPLLRELQKLTASDGAAGDYFGYSVAVSGDTAVIGSLFDDVGVNGSQGSAYVFARSGTNWIFQQKLTANDGAAGDEFGYAVAISGDTIVVGAILDTVGANSNQGSAYVFARSGVSWTQQAHLTASNGAANDEFGFAVGVSSDTVVVAAELDDVGANSNQGSVFVFVRSGVSWTQQAQLTSSSGAADDRFGSAVAISGETVVVGADLDDAGANNDQGSVFVFVRSGATWTQQQKLTASDGAASDEFGGAVAISGDTVVVGAPFHNVGANTNQGSSYVFVRNDDSWTQQAPLTASDGATFDHFGSSVGISGDTVVVGADSDEVGSNVLQGSAYLFVRSGTTWTQEQQLTASDGTAGDFFGFSVGISGDTVVVGAYFDTVGAHGQQGSAYLFVCNWTEQTHLIASDGVANDFFGNSVAISGNTVIVGASRDDVGTNNDQGSAYVFIRSGVTWTEQAKLTASDGATGDHLFGGSVSISGNTAVIGAPGGNRELGSAYVFVRNGTTWTQQTKFTASDGATNDQFGWSVAVSGNTAVVGAIFNDTGANNNQGAAYVFVRSGATWTQQQRLTASDGAAQDQFGWSVAISGDTLVVGAVTHDVGANAAQGSSYVFVRNGATWIQQQQLTSSDGAANDQFGTSVAISGDTLVVGAFAHAVGASTGQGSAYVFARTGASWIQQQELFAFDGAAIDEFGESVAISGDIVVVGAFLHNVGANNDQGAAYVFMRSGTTWFPQQELTASDGLADDHFGTSVGISGNTIVVGAYFDDVGVNNMQGSAYVYFMGCNTSPVIVASGPILRQMGSPSTTSTIASLSDSEDPIGYLSVSVLSAPSGIVISNLTNTNGVVTASISAECNAAFGINVVILQVQDSDGGASTASLIINVTIDTNPALGNYSSTSVLAAGSTSVTPSFMPSDNGSIVQLTATSPTFGGGLGANRVSGVVTINNARPAGTHIITVTAIDNCGNTQSSAFLLTVTCSTITVNPPTIPVGTAGTAFSQTFTQTGGLGTVAFSLSGALPTGLSFNSGTATLSGTPTQVGTFSFTVAAVDAYGCSGSRNYTLTITAPMLVWNGSVSSDWNTASNWMPNAVPTTFNDVLIPTAGVTNQPTISAGSSSINAMTIQSGRTLTINSSLQLSTAADITTSGTITGAGRLALGGATFTQNGSVSLSSVEFTSGNHVLTGGGAFASGIVTVLNGASVTLASNHSVSVIVINSGGSFDVTNRTLTLTGAGTAVFNSGSLIAAGSTIIYQGTVTQVVTANITYNNLTINNAAGVSLAGDTTVNGQLNLITDLATGSFILTMPASGTSTGAADVVGNVKRTGFVTGGAALSFGNPLNTIQINSGTAPTDITMNLVKLPPFGFSNCVSRTYTITANGGSGFSATMRLRYKDTEATSLDESTFELWRYAGTNWVSPTGIATRDAIQNWVEETGITQFSQWTIAGGSGPTCGVLTPNSQFFGVQGAEGSIVLTALASCNWTAASNASWLEITSSQSGSGTDIVTYLVRDNFAPVPRQGILTIAGLTFTVVQDSEAAPDCVFGISASFAAFSASGGAGSVDVIAEERCAWQSITHDSWITITSICCGIGNGTVTYSVAANTSAAGRNGTITIAGQTFSVKQKGN